MPTSKSAKDASQAIVLKESEQLCNTEKAAKCLVHFLESTERTGVRGESNEIAENVRVTTGGQRKVDFLPSELLLSLAKPADRFENLGPGSKGRGKKNAQPYRPFSKKPPDNAWNYPQSREKLKHLVEQAPCICGAGRDISFLYDPIPVTKPGAQSSCSDGIESLQADSHGNQQLESRGDGKGPDSVHCNIVPSEFHIVKSSGVLGLEYYDDKYTTKTEDHKHHLTLFPSLKPAGRQEALQLKHTMNALLKRAGVEDEADEGKSRTADVPTQIHELLALVKEEQTIYNVVFSEVIRQVTVECVERGELLAELRKRYAKLLDKIPRRVKSLHEEVMAQRALDRRLTEELTRFKGSISMLTSELNDVQAHDREVTHQAKESQEQLKLALQESEKNASLLSEYHELYELQRKRLEHQIASLIQERDLWAGGSYILALKVAQKHKLTTSKRLHLHEKAWHKLSSHFSILLDHQDSVQLQELSGHLQTWQDVAVKLNKRLCDAEAESYKRLKTIQEQLGTWGHDFRRVVTPEESTVHVPDKLFVDQLCEDMKVWEDLLNTEGERFTGDTLLTCEDDLVRMHHLVDTWTDVALHIFGRHLQQDGSMAAQYHRMLEVNEKVKAVHQQFKLRSTGENGAAKGLINLVNSFGTWIPKFKSFVQGGEVLLETEWVRLADFVVNEWPSILSNMMLVVAPDDAQDNVSAVQTTQVGAQIEFFRRTTQMVQKWIKNTTLWIENEDCSLVDKVIACHSSMVRWMVTVLHRLAPNLEQEDATEDEDSKQSVGIGASILAECTSETIRERASLLFCLMKSLSKTVYQCSSDIVVARMQKKRDAGDETAEFELRDLKRIQVECDGWIKTANLLVNEVTGSFLAEESVEEQMTMKPREAPGSAIAKDGPSEPPDAQAGFPTPATVKKDDRNVRAPFSPPIEKSNDSLSENKEPGSEVAVKEQTRDGEGPSASLDPQSSAVASDEERRSVEVEVAGDESVCKSTNDALRNAAPEIRYIGIDENIKRQPLDVTFGKHKVKDNTKNLSDARPTSSVAVDSLVTIEKLQSQLLECETRAQTAEERAIDAEMKLKDSQERVRALERALAKSAAPDSQTSSPERCEGGSGTLLP